MGREDSASLYLAGVEYVLRLRRSPSYRLLLLALLRVAFQQTRYGHSLTDPFWCTHAELAKDTGLSIRWVNDLALLTLEGEWGKVGPR